jgi:hypothetical protein
VGKWHHDHRYQKLGYEDFSARPFIRKVAVADCGSVRS